MIGTTRIRVLAALALAAASLGAACAGDVDETRGILCAPIDLPAGWSVLRMPCAPAGLDSGALLAAVSPSGTAALHTFEPETGRWVAALRSDGRESGERFAIERQWAYLVWLSAPARLEPPRVRIRGDVFIFAPGEGRLPGAQLSILEHPQHHTVSGVGGAFSFEDVPAGPVTLVLSHPDYAATQTATLAVGPDGIDRVTLQAPPLPIFGLLAAILGIEPDPQRCQIASTVTRPGASIYGPYPTHGDAGATVTIAPSLPPESGPVYFQIHPNGIVLPDRTLTETSEDGGVVYTNVPPGEYVLRASKPGRTFTEARVLCRAGLLVNASPPYGMAALTDAETLP